MQENPFDKKFMKEALKQANKAAAIGEVPIGCVIVYQGKMNLVNAKYELDARPIEEGCGCPACRRYSRAYIRHLLKAKEMLGLRLCVLHNLYFYNTKIGRAHV